VPRRQSVGLHRRNRRKIDKNNGWMLLKTKRHFIRRTDSRNKKFDDQKTNKMILERLMNQGRRMSRIIAENDNSRQGRLKLFLQALHN